MSGGEISASAQIVGNVEMSLLAHLQHCLHNCLVCTMLGTYSCTLQFIELRMQLDETCIQHCTTFPFPTFDFFLIEFDSCFVVKVPLHSFYFRIMLCEGEE